MKTKDAHVLNWEKITQSTDNNQRENNASNTFNQTVNKGIVFENLIEKLLVAMFPDEVWRRTSESHDGKRDFVYPYEEYLPDQKWAECKNYSSNLSLNIIAPTLIMGLIENIESIFFFSYSPLNDNAIEGLLRYSETSKRTIKIFDGNVLESLICKYHNINGIADFFPNTDFEEAYETLKSKKIRITKMLKDINGNKISSMHLFELGEPFFINIIIQNLTHKQIDYEICIKSSKENLLKYDMSTQYYSLPFTGVEEYSIQCQTLNPGNLNCKIKISTQDTGRTFTVTKKIKIIDEPYLFWTGANAFNVLDQCIQHLADYKGTPLLISSGSGMGKSTLINIILQEECVYRKYNILKIDLNLTRNSCIRNLLSLLVGLHVGDEVPEDQIMDDNKAFSFLIGNYAESAEMISEIIMKFYNYSYPYLFVIDDIQKIDRAYITLFNELAGRSKKENKPIYYIFALNEDKCSIDDLFSRLIWDVNGQNHKCEVVSLTKFSKDDILAFMKHKFGLEKIDKYFDNFETKIRPLDMHSFCANLKRERIIALVPDSRIYQIIDPFKFEENIRHIHYVGMPLKDICKSLGKGDIPEYILKYLYITDRINFKIRTIYHDTINELISLGILKENDGLIVFYHDEIRNHIRNSFVFSEEDYADIYADRDTDAVSKALCALNQIGRIRNSTMFLSEFFRSDYEIRKKTHRFEVCWLIFKNLNQLTKYALTADALNFVKTNFNSLNAEQGHLTFFRFLKHIADSALISKWDTDKVSVENMAYFIKKFFDRSLSTYNYQHCTQYFTKYEKIFRKITHISDSRRYFWLSHYANRAAIALDRTSIPLAAEPDEVSKMYTLSEKYYNCVDSDNELQLQIVVDNFNRHYVYRHNLTLAIVQDTLSQLLEIKQTVLEESMMLDYHLLLLEYLTLKMDENSNTESDYIDLQKRVLHTRERCQSAFYTLKLYMLEIYMLIDCSRFSEANTLLSHVFEFVYKKEMRSYIYKLTYIKAQILIFQDNLAVSSESYRLIVLAFEQLIKLRRNAPNDLKREIFLVVRLVHFIERHEPMRIQMLSQSLGDDLRNLIQELCKYVSGKHVDEENLFDMQSYFIFKDISLPSI